MEKKIEDYLHLYVGCDVLVKDWKGKLIRAGNEESGYPCEVGGDNQDEESGFYGEWEECELKAAFIKPILRPLSDASEGEKHEANMLKRLDKWGGQTPESTAEQVRYLLSKHFDLFGLIEAGLAIDKTKLNDVDAAQASAATEDASSTSAGSTKENK